MRLLRGAGAGLHEGHSHLVGAPLLLAVLAARRSSHVIDEPFKWHKERKHSPATLYHALATLLAIARQCNQWIFVIITDFRWWFWQFGTHPDEYWTSQFIAVARVGDEYAVCLVGELCKSRVRWSAKDRRLGSDLVCFARVSQNNLERD